MRSMASCRAGLACGLAWLCLGPGCGPEDTRLFQFDARGPGAELLPLERALERDDARVLLELDRDEAEALFRAGARGMALPARGAPPASPAAPEGTARALRARCASYPQAAAVAKSLEPAAWLRWIECVSGERAVRVDGQERLLRTRYHPALFGAQDAPAWRFLVAQAEDWGYGPTLEEHAWQDDWVGRGKNLVLSLPGETRPEEVVLLTAHYDSISQQPWTFAPGADDNGSGSATLLEAARVLRQWRMARTVRVVFFTGEEQGLLGSGAYVQEHDLAGVVGVLNLDMFGWDGDGDRCLEIHAGELPASQELGRCLAQAARTHGPDLGSDLLTENATTASDHAWFWAAGVPALEVAENFFDPLEPGECGAADFNPYYHTTQDRVGVGLHPEFGVPVARAALALLANLAQPLGRCFESAPTLAIRRDPAGLRLSWVEPPGAAYARVLASRTDCLGPWEVVAEAAGGGLRLPAGLAPRFFRVEAVAKDGLCASAPSACVPAPPP